METTHMIYCDNQGHMDDLTWPRAEWEFSSGNRPTRHYCDNCRRLAVLLHSSERVHFKRLTLSSAGTHYDQEKGNRT